MRLRWLSATALLLTFALPATVLAESELPGHQKKWRPKNSIVNVFGGSGKNRPLFREFNVRSYIPEPSVSVPSEPAPPIRLLPASVDTGNLTYVPEKLQGLSETAFEEPRPAESDAAAIYDALLSEEPAARVLPAERKAVLAHYRATGFRPLWSKAEDVTSRARDLLALLGRSAEEGLDPGDYALDTLGGFDVPRGGFQGDLALLARFDIQLTASALAYARHASGGRLVPGRLTSYNDIAAPRIDAELAMRMLANSPFAADWLKSLHPAHPAYAVFRQELASLRAESDGEPELPIPAGRKLRLGSGDDRIPALRQRLMKLGLLGPVSVDLEGVPPHRRASVQRFADTSPIFDQNVQSALKALQKRHNLKQSGLLDTLTLRLLNSQGTAGSISKLLVNMERLRWLPRDLGKRNVFVNQAAFQVWISDNGREIWRSNVIVGKPDTQTAAFHDEMETVVFNPSWGVPPSIVTNEMLPILWRDPSYLDRKGFTVIGRNGKKVRSSDVNWAAYGTRPPFSIQQPPGDDNALGEVKFLFPNDHNIYMHDTPTRQLFSRPMRAYSHGCVRVENPRRMAEIVLGMSAEEVAKRIDSGRSQTVRLPHKLPVHITYFTAWPSQTGGVDYFPDLYGRDATIEAAFSQIRVALR